MSTDLQFRKDQLQHRNIPALIIDANIRTTVNEGQILVQNGELIECRTPTSPKHRIPAILVCPPAPKKQYPPTISCKRKLRELDFFESVDRGEIDRFFKTISGSDELVNSKSGVKRRCARR